MWRIFKIILLLLFFITLGSYISGWIYERKPLEYGVTFSQKFAEELGLDWREVYLAILNELLDVGRPSGRPTSGLRLIAYWDKIEPVENIFDFNDLDWQIAEAEKRGAKVILVVGRKVPRWPECHEPKWLRAISVRMQNAKFKNQNVERGNNLSPNPLSLRRRGGEGVRSDALLNYIKTTIEHYRDNLSIVAWQVENEPLFPFGECGTIPISLLNQEIKLVKSLDSRPVILTDSGELGFAWPYLTAKSDIFGTTLYRYVTHRWFGDIRYSLIPASYFRLKAGWAKLWGKDYLISELQAEPWSTTSLAQTSLDRQYKTMNPEIFKEIIGYAERSGFPKAYLWGAEWWYWMKTRHNMPEMWEAAKQLITNNE